MNVQYIYCWGNVSAAPLNFEAFIKEAILFQRHLAGFWCISVSPGAEGTGGGGGGAAWASFIDGIL
jgi:hypothetical protein